MSEPLKIRTSKRIGQTFYSLDQVLCTIVLVPLVLLGCERRQIQVPPPEVSTVAGAETAPVQPIETKVTKDTLEIRSPFQIEVPPGLLPPIHEILETDTAENDAVWEKMSGDWVANRNCPDDGYFSIFRISRFGKSGQFEERCSEQAPRNDMAELMNQPTATISDITTEVDVIHEDGSALKGVRAFELVGPKRSDKPDEAWRSTRVAQLLQEPDQEPTLKVFRTTQWYKNGEPYWKVVDAPLVLRRLR